MKLIIMFMFTIATNAQAFRTVKHESHKDPEFQNYKARYILLMVNSQSKETRFEIEKYIRKFLKNTKVKVTTFSDMFPPTRKWTDEQIYTKISNSNIDSWLIINQGTRNKTITPFMTTTRSNTTINGTYNSNSQYNGYGNTTTNGNFNANANTTSNSYATNLHKSIAEFNAKLMNVKNGRTVWVIDLIVKAGGSLFTTNKGDAKGVSKRIVKVLYVDKIIDK